MKAFVKVGRREGFVSSYNLIFPSGLRLRTEDLTWANYDRKNTVAVQFLNLLQELKNCGWEIEGEVE